MNNYYDKEEKKLRALMEKNENPFSVPSGYFEKLPEKIMDQIYALPDFEKTSAVNPFSVPDGYFENLPAAVADKIVKQKSKFFVWLTNLQRPRIAIPIAFATIIILGSIYFYKQNEISNIQPQELSADDLSNSLYIQCMDEDLFVNALAGEKEINTDDSLEQYLIDNNIDISQIEKEL